jgi:phosphatidylinositol alpha-1,6-mannosyltransferase
VPADRLEDYWRRATVFAMPGSMEGFGIVYIEAMRRSIPVVAATDDAGGRINVDGVTGMNVARADKARLADVLGAAGQARWRERYTFSAFRRRLHDATADFLCTS